MKKLDYANWSIARSTKRVAPECTYSRPLSSRTTSGSSTRKIRRSPVSAHLAFESTYSCRRRSSFGCDTEYFWAIFFFHQKCLFLCCTRWFFFSTFRMKKTFSWWKKKKKNRYSIILGAMGICRLRGGHYLTNIIFIKLGLSIESPEFH